MSLKPLTDNMWMIRVNYSEKNVKKVNENGEAKLNLIVSEGEGGKVIILNLNEISKYISVSPGAAEILRQAWIKQKQGEHFLFLFCVKYLQL